MNAGTHIIGGALVGALIAPEPLVILAAGLAALVPDLDHPRSLISREAWFLPVHSLLRHRGLLHSAFAALIVLAADVSVPAQYQVYSLAASAGYTSHIALDALTVSGVQFWWPIRRRVSLLPIRTGGVGEGFVLGVMLVAFGFSVL